MVFVVGSTNTSLLMNLGKTTGQRCCATKQIETREASCLTSCGARLAEYGAYQGQAQRFSPAAKAAGA